ncbi:kinase-like domain-containing protein [Rhizophagus irregularis DAOM 181602=DAOM 197198]|nr:kinase-like domain-containing protein [Rhizophagus irregularis DAOM 181602=DAOM 197198]
MDETPKKLWKGTDTSKYQLHVTIPTIDSTIESENVDERVVYIGDLEKEVKHFLNEIKSHLQVYLVDIVPCYGITQDPNNKDEDSKDGEDGKNIENDLSSFQFNSDTSYIAQSTSENQISECLDVQLSELELNEICQDDEHNIE